MALITDPDDLNQGTEVTIATGPRTIDLNLAGNLSADGVTLQALYSFLKEEWKSDATLIPHPFPMVAITPEQFEFIENWAPADDAARKLIRTGGWKEIDDESILLKEFAGIVTLGSFEDEANDNAYYQQGDDPTDTTSPVDFTYAGPVNEAIETYNLITGPDASTGFDFTDGGAGNDSIDRNDAGSWITDGYAIGGQVTVIGAETSANDGTFEILALSASSIEIATGSLTADTGDNTVRFARNHRNALNVFLRVRDGDTNGKTFAQSNLTAIGLTALTNKVERFPLSNATDLKISETDANISSSAPYTSIEVRYFDQVFARDVDSAGTPRSFGIVINAGGSHSGVDGSSATSTVFTTAEGGMTTNEFAGGTLTIHEGTDKGNHTVVSNTATTITVSVALTASESNLSFTAHLASPVVAESEEIYEKVQYLLRQASDIDTTGDVITGKTADALLEFVGDTLKSGTYTPANPNGGGSGVIIEGFDSNDTNSLVFVDNGGTERTYPFVAAGTINFNTNLVDDTGPAEYWMFFEYTKRTNVADLVVNSGGTITSALSNLPVLSSGDYVNVSGLTGVDAAMNGVYLLSGTPTAASWDVTRYDGESLVTTSSAAADVDENPIDSPDAILVDDNGGTDIQGTIGSATASFDFDYDGNVQGGRSSATDAAIVLRAIGLDTAQSVETTGTITRATGLSFSLVAALERNYDNP